MKTNYLETIFCKSLNTNIKAFVGKKNIDILQEEATSFTIPSGMEFRPDKIAAYLYGDDTISWVLDLTNNFTDGIKEYYLYRQILVPSIKSIESLSTEE